MSSGPAAYPADGGRDKGYGTEVVFHPAFLKLPGLAAIRRSGNNRIEANCPDMLRVKAINSKQVIGGDDGEGRLLGCGWLDAAA